jgi:creatinine amidohydrolase
MPLGTDSIQAREILCRAAQKLSDEGVTVVVGPIIPLGLSSYHMDFPGTVTLTPSTLSAVLKDVFRSLYTHGFRKFLLKVSHGGNRSLMQVVAQELQTEYKDTQIISVYPFPVSYAIHEKILTSKGKGDGHGGEAETSRILAISPDLVKLERAKPSPGAEHGEPGPIYTPSRSMKNMTAVGSIGYPNYATKEKGEQVLDIMANYIADVVKDRFLNK